jgi:hypothetical protein
MKEEAKGERKESEKRVKGERKQSLKGERKLSPSTALYIPFDVCCTYVSTSHIRCTSFTSRVAPGYGDGTPGMLAGRRYGLYALFSAPAGRGKEPGAANLPKPPQIAESQFCSRSASNGSRSASNRCVRDPLQCPDNGAARVSLRFR